MSSGDRKDGPGDDLLTSEDLFGDMLDPSQDPPAPAPAAPRAVMPPRKGPIKVQVSEPGTAHKSIASGDGGVAGEELPDDIAALLDAFSEPGEAATREQAPEPPRPVAPPPPPPPRPAARVAPQRAPGAGPTAKPSSPLTRPGPTMSDFGGVDQLFEALIHDEPASAPAPPAPAPPPPPAASLPEPVRVAAPAPPEPEPTLEAVPELPTLEDAELAPPPWLEPDAQGDDSPPNFDALLEPVPDDAPPALEVLEVVEEPKPAPAKPRAPAKSADPLVAFLKTLPKTRKDAVRSAPPLADDIPPPASRLGTKFAVATPQPPSGEGGLDLAALADEALSSVTPPAGVSARSGKAVQPAPAAHEPVAPAVAEPQAKKPRVPGAEVTYGPYRLLEKVAVGGMAEVFRAKRSGVEGFEKVVAVKRILPHLSDNKEFLDMFVDEAKMVAGLTHPNIVQIFDLGKIEKSYYIAMEYVHGRDLRSILRRGKERGMRIPLDLAVLVVSRMAAALEYAHRARDEAGRPMKIVHRDVSPQNILVSFEGDVKLTDFGIAKAATKATTTDRGALRGKLLYMSPEQAWGKSMDRRSDIYSLGIVLYEMLTDQKPFLGNSEMSVLEMVREGRVASPATLNAKVPERLEKVVMKLLEKDPDERYQDAAELGRDLERVLVDRQPPTSVALSRYLELLFEADERGDAVREAAPELRGEGSGSAGLEMDFDTTMPGSKSRSSAAQPETPRDPKDANSIQGLLKRFGIK
jgi:serine/threonine protein kinase